MAMGLFLREDKKYAEKYMILCVAGQSNAVGYDESVIPADYTSF